MKSGLEAVGVLVLFLFLSVAGSIIAQLGFDLLLEGGTE